MGKMTEVIRKLEHGANHLDDDYQDALLNDALEFIIERDRATIPMLQTKFKIGYTRAAKILEILESAGYLSEPTSKKGRQILIKPEEFKELEI